MVFYSLFCPLWRTSGGKNVLRPGQKKMCKKMCKNVQKCAKKCAKNVLRRRRRNFLTRTWPRKGGTRPKSQQKKMFLESPGDAEHFDYTFATTLATKKFRIFWPWQKFSTFPTFLPYAQKFSPVYRKKKVQKFSRKKCEKKCAKMRKMCFFQ